MTRKKTVTVEHEGFEFVVFGEYEPYHPGSCYARNGDPGDPPFGGCFEDYDVQLNGKSIADLLSAVVLDAIVEKADSAAE